MNLERNSEFSEYRHLPIGLLGMEFPFGITDNLSVSTFSGLPWLPTLSIISTLHSTKGVRGIDLPDGMGENSDPVKLGLKIF